MQGLVEYERGLCACGWHESLTDDENLHFTFEKKVCPVCAGHAQYDRVLLEGDKKEIESDRPARLPRRTDGRRIFSRLVRPDEDQLPDSNTTSNEPSSPAL